ncbi:MAG: hypothetical protein HDQ88_06670 [Clostridia bacterium]|nr:hypothetical protein [Clostridia bacterium]
MEEEISLLPRAHSLRAGNLIKIIIALTAVLIIAFTAFLGGCALDSKSWVLKTIKNNYYYYDDFNEEGLDELSLYEIADRLDIYSEYYSAEEYAALVKENSGVRAGVGFSYSYVEGENTPCPDGGFMLMLVVGNSPAEAAGMKVGHILTGGIYDGNEVTFEGEDALSEFIDPIPANVDFTLLGSEGEVYKVEKQIYNESYMFMATNNSAWTPTFTDDGELHSVAKAEGREIPYLPDGVAYFSMAQFFGTAGKEFGLLLEKFNEEHCTTLILDLRNNGGGYVSVMQEMAGYFTSAMSNQTYVAMTAEYRNGRKEVYNCIKQKDASLVPTSTKVYVLANSGTASASEALIGALISHGSLEYKNVFLSDFSDGFLDWAKGEMGTRRSYGKGIMQTTFVNWQTGEALKLTTAQIYWPDGTCIHGRGVTEEDGCRTVKADWLVTANDEELQRAVDMIKADMS